MTSYKKRRDATCRAKQNKVLRGKLQPYHLHNPVLLDDHTGLHPKVSLVFGDTTRLEQLIDPLRLYNDIAPLDPQRSAISCLDQRIHEVVVHKFNVVVVAIVVLEDDVNPSRLRRCSHS